jgi:hypothetical protein
LDTGRYEFIDRLGILLEDTATPCHAWALIPNQFHLLLRTGNAPKRIGSMIDKKAVY